MTIIEVKGLKKEYHGQWAVKGLDFQIKEGEIFGLLGPNGAGKTSTINMLIGLARPSAGKILIEGKEIANIKAVQGLMGIVADESNLYNEMDGFDNLCFCASLYGLQKEEREERARELLKQFGLTGAGKRPFGAYSKGMKRKLTIAAAIIHKPKLLFLDEPTTGIDVESAGQIRNLILDLQKQGVTTFITTHYIEEAQRICDRVAFIVEGKIVEIGTVDGLLKNAGGKHILKFVLAEPLKGVEIDLREAFPHYQIEIKGANSLVFSAKDRIPLFPVLQYLSAKGITVFEAKNILPTLEEVFLKVTASK